MSKKFIEKNIKLSLELDRYLSKNPKAFKKIPKGASVIITDKRDSNFSRNSLQIVEKAREENQKFIEARKEGKRWILEPFSV